MAVADCFWYEAVVKKIHTTIVSVILWIITFIISTGGSLLGYHSWAPDVECFVVTVNHPYTNYAMFSTVHVALIIIICCYASLFKIAMRHLKHMSESGSETQGKAQITSMKRHLKAAKTLFIVIGIFCMCWVPFMYNFLYMTVTRVVDPSSLPRRLNNYFLPLLVFNSFINPIIYARKMPAFRQEYKLGLD